MALGIQHRTVCTEVKSNSTLGKAGTLVGRNRSDEEANDQEAPADGADAEAKGGKPEPEEREAGRLASVRGSGPQLHHVARLWIDDAAQPRSPGSNAARFSSM
jgi:hypothetical protein